MRSSQPAGISTGSADFPTCSGCRLVKHAISLGASGAYGRSLAAVENAELDAGEIRGRGHGAAQGIDLLDQMALADAADGGVAAHLAESFHIMREQQGAHTHASGRQGRFGTGMAAADHDDVETGRKVHHAPRACWQEFKGKPASIRPGRRLQKGALAKK